MPKPTQRLALPFLCLAAACGSEESPTPAPASTSATAPGAQVASLVPGLPAKASSAAAPEARMAIDSLVPEGSVAWIRVTSFDDLCDLADEFMLATSGPESEMDFETALQFLPVKGLVENLDRTRSLGIAFGFPEDAGGGAGTQGQMADNIRAVQNFKKMTPEEKHAHMKAHMQECKSKMRQQAADEAMTRIDTCVEKRMSGHSHKRLDAKKMQAMMMAEIRSCASQSQPAEVAPTNPSTHDGH